MLKAVKTSVLKILKAGGVFRLAAGSGWRRSRLLILCYHGVASGDGDEHLWRPALYVTEEFLAQRLAMLKRTGCTVLSLDEGVRRLAAHDLPARSVVLTFDDGGYDFKANAWPLLKASGYPVTVYQSTYYSEKRLPIFHLMCSYLLWKNCAGTLQACPEIGVNENTNLASLATRNAVVEKIVTFAEEQNLTAEERNQQAERLALRLGIDYERILRKRTLQLMTREQIGDLASQGVNFELHTHRHHTPNEETLFRREVRENRERLQGWTGRRPTHFCYPSGAAAPEFLPWLRTEGLASAATCEHGLAGANADPLLLPRFLDTSNVPAIEFESWLAGVAEVMPSLNRQG